MDETIVAFVPIIMAIGQVVKKSGVPERYIPAIELILGLVVGIFYLSEGDIRQGILGGLFVGLSATGLLNGTKITINGSFTDRNGKKKSNKEQEEDNDLNK